MHEMGKCTFSRTFWKINRRFARNKLLWHLNILRLCSIISWHFQINTFRDCVNRAQHKNSNCRSWATDSMDPNKRKGISQIINWLETRQLFECFWRKLWKNVKNTIWILKKRNCSHMKIWVSFFAKWIKYTDCIVTSLGVRNAKHMYYESKNTQWRNQIMLQTENKCYWQFTNCFHCEKLTLSTAPYPEVEEYFSCFIFHFFSLIFSKNIIFFDFHSWIHFTSAIPTKNLSENHNFSFNRSLSAKQFCIWSGFFSVLPFVSRIFEWRIRFDGSLPLVQIGFVSCFPQSANKFITQSAKSEQFIVFFHFKIWNWAKIPVLSSYVANKFKERKKSKRKKIQKQRRCFWYDFPVYISVYGYYGSMSFSAVSIYSFNVLLLTHGKFPVFSHKNRKQIYEQQKRNLCKCYSLTSIYWEGYMLAAWAHCIYDYNKLYCGLVWISL